MKRKLAFLLVLSMVLNLLPLQSLAYQPGQMFTVERWYEDLSGNIQKLPGDQNVATSSEYKVTANLSDPGFGDPQKVAKTAKLKNWYLESDPDQTFNAGSAVEVPIPSDGKSTVIKLMAKLDEKQFKNLTLNTRELPNTVLTENATYNESTGELDIWVSPKGVAAYTGQYCEFRANIPISAGLTVPAKDGFYFNEQENRLEYFINFRDKDSLYGQMIAGNLEQISAKYWAKFKDGSNNESYCTLKVTLHNDDAILPSAADMTVTKETILEGVRKDTGLVEISFSPDKISGEYQKESKEISVDLQVKKPALYGKTIAYYSINDTDITALTDNKAIQKIVLCDSAGKVTGETTSPQVYEIYWYESEESTSPITHSQVSVTLKHHSAGESHYFEEAKAARVHFRLTCWPQNEPQPFDVAYKDGFYQITLHMTKENWQKAYDNRIPGEDGLFLETYVDPLPTASYGKRFASGIVIGHPDEEKGIAEVMTNHQEFYSVTKQTFGTAMKIAAIIDSGNAATINPQANKGHQLSVSWEDSRHEMINVASSGTAYCEYVTYGIAFDDASPVQIDTTGFKTDGSNIVLDVEGTFTNYVAKGETFIDNSINYYLNGDEIDDEVGKDPTFKASHNKIVTGFIAPDNAVECIVNGSSHKLTATDRMVKVETSLMDGSDYAPITNRTYAIIWVFADGSRTVDKPIAVRVTLIRDENAFDKAGWVRTPVDRMILPESICGKNGLDIEAEAGHLNTDFTGEEIYPIWEEEDTVLGIKIPTDLGKIVKYEINHADGANRYHTQTGLVQEVIGHYRKQEIQEGQDTIWFQYMALPKSSTVIEGSSEFRIYTGYSCGMNEDCAAWTFIRWYGENDVTLGTEWIYHTANKCIGIEDYVGRASVSERVKEPVLLDDELNLRVEYYASQKIDTTGRTGYYVRMYPIDEKGFEVYTGEEKVIWPYEEGVTKDNITGYDYEVVHYTDESHAFKASVKKEYLTQGIQLTMNSFSPFMMLWNLTPTPSPTPDPGDNGGSSGSSTPKVSPDPAVTPIITAANGNQMIGAANISKPISKLTAEEQAALVSAGSWSKDAYGRWSLKDASGNTYKSCWALVSDALSSKSVGNASWYYFDASGNMVTGWIWIPAADGKQYCYYFNKEDGSMYGACVTDGTTVDGYKVNGKGRWTDANGKEQTK